jgi:hypothetical protein
MPAALTRRLDRAFGFATLALLLAARDSFAQSDLKVCAAAAEDGQRLAAEGKLSSAREKLLSCARPQCRSLISKDCQKWLEEVDERTPTIVVAAVDTNGKDVVDVRVLIDGVVLAEHFDGRALAIDPGAHVIRVETASGLEAEERLMAREGEKERIVRLRVDAHSANPASPGQVTPLAGGAPPTPAPASAGFPGAGGATHAALPEPNPSSGRTTATYAVGALGIAGLATFAAFGVKGVVDRADLINACKPSCSPSQIDAVHREFLVADVALAVGGVATGIVAWLLLTRERPTRPVTAHVAYDPHSHAAVAGVGGHF